MRFRRAESGTAPGRRTALRVAVVYVVVAGLYIVFSDRLIALVVADAGHLSVLQTMKGSLFVVVTAALVYFLVVRAATDLWRTNRLLVESEQRYRQIVETAAEGIIAVDAAEVPRITFANGRVAEMLGCRAEELLGRSALEFVDADWQEVAREQRARTKYGLEHQFELKMRRHDGGELWVSCSANALLDAQGRYTGALAMLTDISERRRVALELDQFFHLAPEMLCLAGFDGYFKRVNPAFEKALGYTAAELLARPFVELVHADDRAATQAQMEKIRAGEPVLYFENRYRHKDGGYRWLAWATTSVTSEQLLYAAARDVTEDKALADSLRRSEALQSSVFRAVPITIDVITNRTFGLSNGRLAQMTGYTPEELSGQSTRMIFACDEDFRSYGERIYRNLRETGVASEEMRWRCKDGRILEILSRAAAIDRNDLSAGVVFTGVDITERKRAERAIRDSEARFRTIFENAPIGINVYDTSGRLVSCNRATLELFGLKAEDVPGGFGLADDPNLPPGTWERLQTGEAVRFECRYDFGRVLAAGVYPTNNTGVIDLDVVVTPLRPDGKTCSGYLLLLQDFTERKRLEDQLRQSQKLEAIGRLAGGVSHDFNNILTAILGNVELMRQCLRQPTPTYSLTEGLDQIERAGQRAATLTRQLLTFSRRQVARPEVLDPNQVIRDLEKMLLRLIREDVALTITLAPELHSICIDAGHLEQVLVNLVVNARDALPRGGHVLVETANVTLDEEYVAAHADARAGPHVMLAVSDTGTGMDAATLAHAFEPFFTTKPAGEGTGLGLATVHGIVRQVGGHIAVYTELGHGSTFRVYFPAVGAAGAPEAAQPEAMEVTGGSETVLVCDDDETIRSLVRRTLEAKGYQTLVASGPAQAIKLAAEHAAPIHLLVTDVIMAEMNGRGLADALRAVRPDVRVLYMSGYTSDVVHKEGSLPARAELLSKPFRAGDLLKRVRAILDRKNGAAAGQPQPQMREV